ncbi:Ran-binding-domain-containing protein [Trichodelitschia bisporula]|uniref:Ran-binding-domain-containing protein n=1 Tax=Trichodelitschia bisporula TaxID=703511 RepID=A0A6G1HRU8_9PEZI|nr:Ran-binding-domain-containing protein [Trichodelitschia bisporula]
MDILLERVTQQAMNYAIRTGVAVASGFAVDQFSRLLRSVKGSVREELSDVQIQLETKIRIISPAIDMIEVIAARGNTSLDSALSATKQIRLEIQALGKRLSAAAGQEELIRRGKSKLRTAETDLELKLIVQDVKRLLKRIDESVPLMTLAISTSGVNISTALPSTVSPSRLLQASTFLSAGDTQYAMGAGQTVQIGPAFVLSVYMLFSGHSTRPHDEGFRETTWKEVIHKARVKLLRTPMNRLYDLPDGTRHPGSQPRLHDIPAADEASEFSYQLLIVEDLQDGRVHTFEENEPQPAPFDDVLEAGIREVVPIHQVSKIFYADTGKILNIGNDGESNNPVLLLKRDLNAAPPRRMMEQQTSPWDQAGHTEEANAEESDDDSPDAQLRRESTVPLPEPMPQLDTRAWRFPPNLDPEWIAMEVYVDAPESEGEEEDDDSSPAAPSPQPRPYNLLTQTLANLHLRGSSRSSVQLTPEKANARPSTPRSPASHSPSPSPSLGHSVQRASNAPLPALRTSLSLLELLIRLTALQQFQQTSHLAINDELLNFFLSESSSTGAGGDAEYRQRVRRDARRRVGFDPYDESPIKLHGEDYQRQAGSPREWDAQRNFDYDMNYGYSDIQSDWQYGVRRGSPAPSSPLVRQPFTRGMTPPRSARGVKQPIFSPGTPEGEFRGIERGSAAVLKSVEVVQRNDSALGTSPATEQKSEGA